MGESYLDGALSSQPPHLRGALAADKLSGVAHELSTQLPLKLRPEDIIQGVLQHLLSDIIPSLSSGADTLTEVQLFGLLQESVFSLVLC